MLEEILLFLSFLGGPVAATDCVGVLQVTTLSVSKFLGWNRSSYFLDGGGVMLHGTRQNLGPVCQWSVCHFVLHSWLGKACSGRYVHHSPDLGGCTASSWSVIGKMIGVRETYGTIFIAFPQLRVIVTLSDWCWSSTTDICPDEFVISIYKRHQNNGVESFAGVVHGPSLWFPSSMYGGNSTFHRTCQQWHAIHQEWWGKSSSRPCIHRWWFKRLLGRGVTGCCDGPSNRIPSRHTCSQRQGDANSGQASCQAPGAPCTRFVTWWTWAPLWLAAHRTSRGTSAWTSWKMFGPRFGVPPEAGRTGQIVVASRSMVWSRLPVVDVFSSSYWHGSGEVPIRWCLTDVGERLVGILVEACHDPPSLTTGGEVIVRATHMPLIYRDRRMLAQRQ